MDNAAMRNTRAQGFAKVHAVELQHVAPAAYRGNRLQIGDQDVVRQAHVLELVHEPVYLVPGLS